MKYLKLFGASSVSVNETTIKGEAFFNYVQMFCCVTIILSGYIHVDAFQNSSMNNSCLLKFTLCYRMIVKNQ